MAMIEQRLGRYERALEIYRSLESGAEAMRPTERARLLSNVGALYRRLGDPYKAIDVYKQAEQLFSEQQDLDGEIGVVTNRGIALAMELGDLSEAVAAFGRAERLAAESGNRRERSAATLYASEALRRMGHYPEARAKATLALQIARELKSPEEEWKAVLSLGRISEASRDNSAALASYREAIEIIEKLRTGIAAVGMRAAFLGDKIDAYDGAVRTLLTDFGADPTELFAYMEQSRARTLRDRLRAGPQSLDAVRSRLPAGTAIVEYWSRDARAAALWITRDEARVFKLTSALSPVIDDLLAAIKSGTDDWTEPARQLGLVLLAPLPLSTQRRLIIVPGRLHPFRSLAVEWRSTADRRRGGKIRACRVPATGRSAQQAMAGSLGPYADGLRLYKRAECQRSVWRDIVHVASRGTRSSLSRA